MGGVVVVAKPYGRVTKTIMTLPSGKFLRVPLEIALGRFQTVSKVSGWSRKFMDDLDIFQIAWKFSRLPGKIPDSVDTS